MEYVDTSPEVTLHIKPPEGGIPGFQYIIIEKIGKDCFGKGNFELGHNAETDTYTVTPRSTRDKVQDFADRLRNSAFTVLMPTDSKQEPAPMAG